MTQSSLLSSFLSRSLVRAALVSTAVAAAATQSFAQSAPYLGEAANFAVFGGSNSALTISSGNTRVTGNYGEGPNSSLDFSGGGIISGQLVVDPSSHYNISGGSTALGGVVTSALGGANNALVAASNYAAGLAPGMTLGSITNSTGTLNRLGSLSVYDVTNDLSLSGGGKLTLNGSASDAFVLNIDGTMTLSGGSSIALTGGLMANNVFVNFVGTGQGINFNGNSMASGNFMAVSRDITVSGGVINGRILGADGYQLKLQSGPSVIAPSPEPVMTTALLLGTSVLFFRRRR